LRQLGVGPTSNSASGAPDGVSWYRPHLDRSLELIDTTHLPHDAAILDVGCGASTLAGDLLYATLLFGGFAVLERLIPAVREPARFAPVATSPSVR